MSSNELIKMDIGMCEGTQVRSLMVIFYLKLTYIELSQNV